MYNPQPGRGRTAPSAYRIFDRRGRVTTQGLVESPPHGGSYEVYGDKRGFVLVNFEYRRAWRVTSTGEVSKPSFDGTPTQPRPGDVFLGDVFNAPWLFRPSTNRIHRHVIGPPRATITHVDGHGVWWARGKPENGQAVVYSAGPGEPWTKHVIGEFSSAHTGCVCDPMAGPLGRGPVIVVAGLELSHVSLDYGRTWRTWDLADSVPFTETFEMNRPPQVASLPDGRLVIGYMQHWVATDSTNQSFVQRGLDPEPELWLAGLTNELLLHAGQASPDGGHTWLPYR